MGTPGRLLDHLKRGTIDISKVKTIVLDEADEMLDMGFIQDIESILKYASSKHQTLLFSATMPKPILRIGEKFMNDPEIVKIKGKVIAYKSQKAEEEIAEAQNALNILGGKVTELQTVLIKEIDSIRVNIVIEKIKNTPKEYPRGKNLPKLKPII